MRKEYKPLPYLAVFGILATSLTSLVCAQTGEASKQMGMSQSALAEIMSGAGEVGVLADGSTSIRLEDGTVLPASVGTHPLVRKPLPKLPMPDHPFLLDETASGGVHGDTYNSSTTPFPGPLGIAPKALYTSTAPGNLISLCTPLLNTVGDKLASVCVGLGTPSQLTLFDPARDFKVAAQTATIDAEKMQRGQVGLGWYSALDNQGRAIVDTPDRKIRLYSLDQNTGKSSWTVVKEYDLASVLDDSEPISDVKPDWHNNLWFSSGLGRVGVLNPSTGAIQQTKLPAGEISGTAMAISQEGVFILTTRALYRFELDSTGKLVNRWRFAYGTSNSPHGDLTAPTLFDGGKLISFGLNDDEHPRARALVLKTDGADMLTAARIVCEHPVFKPGKGYLDNTFVGYGKSLVIQNNYGAAFFEPGWSEPGLVRVDVRPDYSGCDTVWENYSVSSKVPPKLSTADGYVYELTRRLGTQKDLYAMYLSAVDFRTGRLASELFVGTGKRLDSPMLSVNFTPDGAMLAGVRNGLVVLKDSAPSIQRR